MYFIVEIQDNRQSLGIRTDGLTSKNMLVNEFISEVIFTRENERLSEEALCVAKLSEVTIINIRMNQHHAIVLTKYNKPTLVSAISTIGKDIWPIFAPIFHDGIRTNEFEKNIK